MIRVGIYNRVSKEEQARDSDALRRMIFHCDRSLEKMGINPADVPHFEDRQSGRDDDRVNFERMRRKLEAKAFDLLIVYRIDRITRRLVTNAELAELFQKHKIKVYTVVGDRTFDFDRRADWEDFVNQGVRAEGESRELEMRVRLGLEFRASQGKFLGAIPFGYRRVDGLLVPDDRPFPDSPLGLNYFETGCKAVEILAEANAIRPGTRQVKSELGWKIEAPSLRRWALSSAVQGHSISKYAEFLNTHPAIATLDQAERIAKKDIDRSVHWGQNKKRYVHLFTGLVFCANCGSRMQAKPSNGHNYYRCAARVELDADSICTRTVPERGSKTIKEETIEEAIRIELIKNAEALVQADLNVQQRQQKAIDPVVAKGEKQIRSLQRMIEEFGDDEGLLTRKIRAIENQIESRKNEAEQSEIDNSARLKLIEYARDWDTFDEMDRWEKKAYYKSAIKRVSVNWSEITCIDLMDRVKPIQY